MYRRSVFLLWAAVVLFLGAFMFPLWSISLSAPQYPEGMGMKIWIDKITGDKPHDLQNINGLNHYIGMRKIDANSIPELRFMRFIVAGLVIFGAAAALTRRRALALAWVLACLAVSAIGLADFYRWGYEYGHDLDPDAPIKVPGMAYQPPLVGSKKLLNITATSLPGPGGAALMIGVGLGALALGLDWRREMLRRDEQGSRIASPLGGKSAGVFAGGSGIAALAAIAVSSCSPGPEPIRFGEDACAVCRMTISDERYGAELVTGKGRIYKYDSIECMADEMSGGAFESADVKHALAVDYARPGELVEARSAVYLHSPTLRSPMGMNLTSFADRSNAESAAVQHPGELLSFDEVLSFVGRSSGPGGGHR